MADTAIPDEEIEEFAETETVLQEKVRELAKLIRQSRYNVFYTGAGISTSAGISDFRGPDGVWTRRSKGLKPLPNMARHLVAPTFAHRTLVALMKKGLLHFVISQNCDGLHLKSGIPPNLICELHGNGFVEACAECGAVYLREKSVSLTAKKDPTLFTGTYCDKCQGKLRFTVVKFGQSLPDLCLERATKFSNKARLAVCIGTSMRVSPACELPMNAVSKGGKLVIINLQKTPYDDACALRIFAKADQVMELLVKELGVTVPEWEPRELWKDPEYLKKFSEQYVFRSPSHEWFPEE